MVKYGLLWCWFKCSQGVRGVLLSANPDNLGYVNQTKQFALKTDIKPS